MAETCTLQLHAHGTWHDVAVICELGVQVQKERRKKGPGLLQRAPLVAGLKAMAHELERVAAEGESMGLDAPVLAHLRLGILARAQELNALT